DFVSTSNSLPPTKELDSMTDCMRSTPDSLTISLSRDSLIEQPSELKHKSFDTRSGTSSAKLKNSLTASKSSSTSFRHCVSLLDSHVSGKHSKVIRRRGLRLQTHTKNRPKSKL